jgi:membrane-anchored protein YejM (alkaline phosphatase superfamily)
MTENFLLCTFDSCRFDSFVAARKPVLGRFGEPKRAYTHGAYTLPAHQSMFVGFLPHVHEEEPFYNRFIRQLWRINFRHVNVEPLVRFSNDNHNVVEGFASLGYQTLGCGAMNWFRPGSPLRNGFQRFERTKTDARRQVDLTADWIRRDPRRPFFAFINFGETHYPYTYAGMPGVSGDITHRQDLARLRCPDGLPAAVNGLDESLWRQQVACVEYLDAQVGRLFAHFERLGLGATVVVCADHGDALGEDGMFGHGFCHPKVMEVPMLIFRCGRASA